MGSSSINLHEASRTLEKRQLTGLNCTVDRATQLCCSPSRTPERASIQVSAGIDTARSTRPNVRNASYLAARGCTSSTPCEAISTGVGPRLLLLKYRQSTFKIIGVSPGCFHLGCRPSDQRGAFVWFEGTLNVFGRVEGELHASIIRTSDGGQVEGTIAAQELTIGFLRASSRRTASR
jgi:hypothetical protein